ncbi:MAG: hypothetical protein H6773_02605 [Pseudomonadales bacterium]|nr:hypothetical protein [Candidatus Woesebacteria bacterium]MCB9801046.1 hypothetical protein [Pseudomonadales bacterium]
MNNKEAKMVILPVDYQSFDIILEILQKATLREEYVREYIQIHSQEDIGPQNPAKTFGFALNALPLYCRMLDQHTPGMKIETLNKALVWLGSLAAYAQHVSEESYGELTPPFTNPNDWHTEEMKLIIATILRSLKEYPSMNSINALDASTLTKDQLESVFIAFCYLQISPFIEKTDSSTP